MSNPILMTALKLYINLFLIQFFCFDISTESFRVICTHLLLLLFIIPIYVNQSIIIIIVFIFNKLIKLKMHENSSTPSQLKSQQFRNQIRSRMKADIMRKIRNSYLKMEQPKCQQNYNQKLSIQLLTSLINQQPSKQKIMIMNKIILQKRQQIPQQVFQKLINYTMQNFLNIQPAQLQKKVQLNDLISLFSNVISTKKYIQITKTLNLPQIAKILLALIKITSKQTGSYILWVLNQLVQINGQLVEFVVGYQYQFKEIFGLANIYLSYLFCTVSQCRIDLFDARIIQQYTYVPISQQTQRSYCQNITIIFSNFLSAYKNTQYTKVILKWVCNQIVSPAFDFYVKNTLFKLLQYMIKQCLDLPNLIILINQPVIIEQIIQRSFFDSQYQNKLSCINTINEIIKISPKMQLQDLIQNYPSIIQSVISAFKLCDLRISVQCLSSIAKIILNMPNQRQINCIFMECGLRLQLQVLKLSQNSQISNLACVILEDYLGQEL